MVAQDILRVKQQQNHLISLFIINYIFLNQKKKNFNINKAIEDVIKIYNNIVHLITRIERILVLKIKNNKNTKSIREYY